MTQESDLIGQTGNKVIFDSRDPAEISILLFEVESWLETLIDMACFSESRNLVLDLVGTAMSNWPQLVRWNRGRVRDRAATIPDATSGLPETYELRRYESSDSEC